MEEPKHILPSPCNNPKSPEFEFWMVRNPSCPQPILHSADELFSDGVLLPLHHLRLSDDPPEFPWPGQTRKPDPSAINTNDPPEISGSGQTRKPDPLATYSSKRWRDIFKRSDKKSNTTSASCENESSCKVKGNSVNKGKKRDKKINGGAGGFGSGSGLELNIINIWPFTRSRSAGNGGARPRSTAAGRKVSSAPCSRSNSAGESKSRKLASSSPGRVGVHLGRTSPVWQQARRSTGTEKVVKKDGRRIPTARLGGGGPKASVLNLNVPVSIGYRHHLSCKSDHENSAVSIPANAEAASGGGGVSSEGLRGGSNFFNIRSLFTKKVY